jgi:hypothetical protein
MMQIFRGLSLFILLVLAGCQPEEDKQQEMDYPVGLKQIHAEAFFDQGLRGTGVKIGILDFGFGDLWNDPSLRRLVENGQIVFMADYTHSDSAAFYKNMHGTNVLRYMGGIDPKDSLFRDNLAAGANFYLAMVAVNFEKKSDDRVTEFRIDSALYDMYTLGVRLVNLSMGFWDEYANEEQNYSPGQMDGRTTAITKICQKWAMRGMIIVNSAGNTGEYAWRTIWAPSDAPDAIAVGAARFPDKVFKASYSGTGNPEISYVKPDLVAFSPWGTSFSANVVTGIVACMLQKDSALTLHEIREILFRSSTLYPFPNNYVGYGIPDARKILAIMDDPERDVSTVTRVTAREGRYTIKTTTPNNVVFEKTDHYRVRRQYIDEATDGKVTVTGKGGIMFTTVVTGEKAWEICWE